MLDHIGFPVSDLERSRAFYTTALKPLAIVPVMEVTAEQTGGDAHVGFGADGPPSSGSAAARGRQAASMSPSPRRLGRWSTPSTARRSTSAARTTDRPDCGRTTTRPITARSCWTPTATTSKRYATGPNSPAQREPPGRTVSSLQRSRSRQKCQSAALHFSWRPARFCLPSTSVSSSEGSATWHFY